MMAAFAQPKHVAVIGFSRIKIVLTDSVIIITGKLLSRFVQKLITNIKF